MDDPRRLPRRESSWRDAPLYKGEEEGGGRRMKKEEEEGEEESDVWVLAIVHLHIVHST